MTMRLQKTLAVMDEKMQSCRQKIISRQTGLVHVAKSFEICFIGENFGAPCNLMKRVSRVSTSELSSGCFRKYKPGVVVLYGTAKVQPVGRSAHVGTGEQAYRDDAETPQHEIVAQVAESKFQMELPDARTTTSFQRLQTLAQHIDFLHGQRRFYCSWSNNIFWRFFYVISRTETVVA